MRFRVGGTKEWMAQQAGHREGSKEDMNQASTHNQLVRFQGRLPQNRAAGAGERE
jgi:hypothetical protein